MTVSSCWVVFPSTAGDDAELVLELLCPTSPGGAQTQPPHPFTHFSWKGQKGGKTHESAGHFVLFTVCCNRLYAHIPQFIK